MIKAIVFDFDGLIYDTETPEFRSFQAIFQSYGHELALSIWSQWVGTDSSKFNPYDYLEKCVGTSLNREEIRRMRRAHYEQLMAVEMARPGVEAYLHAAASMGLRIGLASSSSRDWVIGYLRDLNLLAYFECIRVREDTHCVKPNPDLYLQVLQYFGIEPQEAIAFEDSPNGALAAKRAGMHCVVVPNDITRELTFGEVDMYLQSMGQMPLAAVAERFATDHNNRCSS